MNNTLHVIGFAGGDPEVTTIEGGAKVAKFSLGVKEYKADGGESTMWINVEAWAAMSDRVMALVKSGRELALTGRLAINRYDKQVGDEKITMTRVVLKLQGIHACGSKSQSTSKSTTVTKKSSKKQAA